MNPSKNSMGKFKKVYTRKEILSYLKSVARIIGRSPTYRDLHKIPGPRASTAIRYFGSWSRAIKLAGLRPLAKQLIKGEKSFVRSNWRHLTDREIAKKLKLPVHIIRYYRLSSKLWKNTRNNRLTKGTQKKLAIKLYGNACEICNLSIVELHHIVPASKIPEHWSVLCPLCHSLISRKVVEVKSREDLLLKLKPIVKKIYSSLKI